MMDPEEQQLVNQAREFLRRMATDPGRYESLTSAIRAKSSVYQELRQAMGLTSNPTSPVLQHALNEELLSGDLSQVAAAANLSEAELRRRLSYAASWAFDETGEEKK